MNTTLPGCIEKLGPGAGGALFYPEISPHDSQIMLAACDMSGAYITRDGGGCWHQFNLKCGVSAFAFDPVDRNVIYAGSTGLFRSEDLGRRWTMIFPSTESLLDEMIIDDEADSLLVTSDNWPGGRVVSICIDPENSNLIHIAVQSENISIFTSTDKGRTWNSSGVVSGKKIHGMYPCTDSKQGKDLLILANDGVFLLGQANGSFRKAILPCGIDTILHGSAGSSARGNIKCYIIGVNSSDREPAPMLWKADSPDYVWEKASPVSVPGTDWPELKTPVVCRSVKACAGAGDNVYLSVENQHLPGTNWDVEPYFYGILKSCDSGGTWQWVLTGSRFADPLNRAGGWVEHLYDYSWHYIGPKGGSALGLAVAPADPDICLYTDLGAAFITKDAGGHWSQVYCNEHDDGGVSTRGLDVATCYGVHFDPFDRDHIVISYTDCGMFHSKNAGKSWLHALTGLSPQWGNTCYWMVFDPAIRGRAWSAWAYSHDLPRAKMFRGDGLARSKGGICRTENGLMSWHKSNCGMADHCIATHITLDPVSPAGCRTLYTTTFGTGVYKSTDDGRHWELKNNGLGENRNAWRIYINPAGELYLVVARGLRGGAEQGGAVYRSVNGAEEWEPIPLPEGVNAPNDITIGPGGEMYLSCWPRFQCGAASGGGGIQDPRWWQELEESFQSSRSRVYRNCASG